ncbi:hypothetical protein Tco_0739305, partial [Tanacetum coccineum]
APSTSDSSSTSDIHLPVQHQEIAEEPIQEDTPIIHDVLHPSHNLVTGDPGSAQSSSGNVNAAEPNQVNYPPDHIRRWTKDHPLDNIVGNPSRPHEALAGPDPEPMNEDQTGSDSGKLHVSLVGPNPEHMDDEFLAKAYLKVHENLKLITDECIIDDKPESQSGSMSSMKNLDDTFNFGDQFFYD